MTARLQELESVICKAAGITAKELREPNRTKELVDARHAIWLIAKDYIGFSYKELARYYNRDRTTIMHGVARLKETGQHNELLLKLKERYPEIVMPDPKLQKKGIERWTF